MDAVADSCIYLDIFTRDKRWFSWSSAALASAADTGNIIINPVIYAEISISFDRVEALEALLDPAVFLYRMIPREAAFLSGKCFLQYRRRGGKRTGTLPDFFIGAHAAVAGLPLITRNPEHFRKTFPKLDLIFP